MVALRHGDGVTPAAAMRNWMAEEGARLADGGYPVIPIAALAKFPGQYTPSRGWDGMLGWQRFCDRLPKAFELDIWRRWPGCGVGIAGGVIVGTDIDVLDPDVADRIEVLARTELGDTPAARVGRAPKKLLVYRAAGPFQKVARHPVEIIARGGQFVAYGTHPDTQEPYRWPVDDLSELPLSALPIVTEEQCRRFLDAAYAMVPAELRRNKLGPDRSAEFYKAPGGELRGTVEAVGAALPYIPNDDLDYDSWVRIGLALKGALGEDGLPLWLAWSAESRKSGKSGRADTARRAWRSFKPREIGAGTIYGYATKNGWNPDFDLVLNGAVAEAVRAVPNPGAGLIAKAVNGHRVETPEPGPETEAATEPAPAPAAPLPFVTEAPGLLGDMVRWMTATAVSPQPFLALGASLCALGVAMGRRYRLEAPDTRSNVYVIALADSGGGKDHPRKCVRRLLVEAGLGSYLGGETLASGSALMTSVAQHPARLFQVDEFGHFIQAVLDPKSHAHHRREIMTNLTTLWSSAAEIVIGTEYANQKERPRLDIQQPCVCVYGSTVPGTFWSALQSGNVGDGSLARFLVFQSERNYPDEQEPEPVEDRMAPIVERIGALTAGDGRLGSIMVPNVAPTPLAVPMDGDGEAADRDLRQRHLEMKRRHEGTPFAAIVARHREHVRRLALIAAVAADHGRPVVTAGIYAWAGAVVDHCQATILDQAQRFVADNEHEALAKRVLEIIRRHGGWMDGSTIANCIRFVPRKLRGELIIDLVEGGFLDSKQESTTTKPRTLVRAVDGNIRE